MEFYLTNSVHIIHIWKMEENATMIMITVLVEVAEITICNAKKFLVEVNLHVLFELRIFCLELRYDTLG